MYLFFSNLIQDKVCILPETESKHAIHVLRMTVGTELNFIDGKGGFYTGNIIDAHPKRCTIQITDTKKNYGQRPYSLHIAIAPTKNIDRFEWFLEKSTEFGIDRITPLLCQRSERKVIKMERSNRVIVAAAKQSLKASFPVLDDLTPFSSFISSQTEAKKLIAHCDADQKIEISQIIQPKEEVLILIGPEGDFSPKEIELAKEQNYQAISLGSSRLRTETAGVAACHSVYYINN